MADKNKKIILVGGGTLGSVSPLLAIAVNYRADYLFVGTIDGPEKDFVLANGLNNFASIHAGKLRRYFDWQNFLDFFRAIWGFFESLKIILKFKPDIILSAGSFVAVPMALSAWILRVSFIVHQQDIKVGLANRLMAPLAKKITIIFPEQEKDFSRKKVVLTGNPVRKIQSRNFDKPVVVITGGGIGARGLNDFVSAFIPKLLEKYEVYHFFGSKNFDQSLNLPGYHPQKFMTSGLVDLLSRADIIISRAGMSLISEAASLKKALVLVPMPGSHQEKNASYLAKHNAAFMVKQGNYQIMERYLEKLLVNQELRLALGENLYKLFPQNAVNDYKILIDQMLNKD
ncbi:MAG: glycosyltransferase [bacterium]|nr:glycosyltransferase [bacterium]